MTFRKVQDGDNTPRRRRPAGLSNNTRPVLSSLPAIEDPDTVSVANPYLKLFFVLFHAHLLVHTVMQCY